LQANHLPATTHKVLNFGVIEVESVSKSFHTTVALENVSLRIPRGEVLGILGPNGAGKTTLFKLLAGFLAPDRGRILPAGGVWPAIGYKPERLLFPGRLRVSEYLEMMADLSNVNPRQRRPVVAGVLAEVGLLGAAGKKIKDCSKGMRQRLALGQALVANPPLLLLDEPSNGLDPEGQEDICRQIVRLRQEGRTIVLASHQLHEVTQVCTELVILKQGAIHYQSSMAKALAERPQANIHVDRDLEPLAPLLRSMHPAVVVDGQQIVLPQDALHLRLQIMSILIGSGYDILQLTQKRATLAEIYAEAVQ
jgi:ABC-2 type transport system ATP-binding protein